MKVELSKLAKELNNKQDNLRAKLSKAEQLGFEHESRHLTDKIVTIGRLKDAVQSIADEDKLWPVHLELL